MVWMWWPLGSLRLRRHTAAGCRARGQGPPPPRARGRPFVSLRAGSRRGARRQQADRRRGLPAGVEEARAGRPMVGEQRGPSSRHRRHCGMEKRPACGARSSRGRTVRLSSPLSPRLLRPRHWCSLGASAGVWVAAGSLALGTNSTPEFVLLPPDRLLLILLISPYFPLLFVFLQFAGIVGSKCRGELFYSLPRGGLSCGLGGDGGAI